MALQGSEDAHDRKLRELAGPDAEWAFSTPKKDPTLDAPTTERITSDGIVCFVKAGNERAMFCRHAGETIGLAIIQAHAGYRRRYLRLSGASAETSSSRLSRNDD